MALLRIIFRFSHVGLAALTLVFVAFSYSHPISADNATFETCRTEPSSLCMTDLGVGLADAARSLPPYMREVEMLAQMGRIEDAFALELRATKEKDRPPDNIEATVNRRLASHRITAAIRNGIDLDTAIERTPEVDPGVLFIGALDLLGRSPYGIRTGPKIIADEQVLDVVSDMAQRIAKMAQEQPERPQISSLMFAAELQAALGNRTEVIRLLEALPRTNDPHISPPEDFIRLVGSQETLRLYREAGGRRANIFLTAASAETDLSLATEYLKTAFNEFSSEKPWPDFKWMERTIERAASLGLQSLALELAHELSKHADTAPSVFPVFSHIKAARALAIAGADEGKVQERLERAQSYLPQSKREIVGAGVVSGAIVWGSSGLDAQARREIANLRARMGETEATIRIMDGIDEPVFAWNEMLTSDIPIETLDVLLDAANDALSREEHAYIRAQHAQEILFFGGTEEQRHWVQDTALALLQTEQFDGDRAVVIYSTLTRIGARLEDQSIQIMALERMAEAALKSRRFRELITVGFYWQQSGLMP